GAIVGNTLYIGGSFFYVGPHTGSCVTLDPISGSATGIGDVDGTVFTAEPDNAGGWFIGGAFSEVGGQRRENLAHITGDGNVSSWNPGANSDVLSMKLDGNRLYVGGRFTSTGAAARSGLAALDADTGLPQSWNPHPISHGLQQPSVLALAISGSTV